MAPRKRKNEALSAEGEEVPLRRSTRQKPVHAPDKEPDKEAEKEPGIKAVPLVKKRSTKPPVHEAATTEGKVEVAEAASTSKAELPTSSHKFTTVTISPANKGGKPIACLSSYTQPPSTALIFTHGAGGDLSAAAMVNFSQGYASSDPTSGLIMFPGNMNLKARAASFDIVKQHETQAGNFNPPAKGAFSLACGGRSLGARAAVVASHMDKDISALVLVSYPLVSPSGDVRDKILLDLAAVVDVLFISGDGDSMCDLEMLDKLRKKMKPKTWMVRVHGADHGMNLRGGKKLKEGTEIVGKATGRIAAEWLTERDEKMREMDLSWNGEMGEVKSTGWNAK